MPTPYLGEIKLISFNFPPQGWAWCDGQELQISANSALFSLLRTTYGGDGSRTFRLPDLRGRVPSGWGDGTFPGTSGGSESVSIGMNELPSHFHSLAAVDANANSGPTFHFFASANAAYQPAPKTGVLAADTISQSGGGQPHENRQPFAVVGFVIALQGVYPNTD